MWKKLLIFFAVAAVLPVHAVEWMTDFEAAKAKAQAEDKAVLLEFTGSDWCHFCIVQRRRVLDTPAFEKWGADKFVYVEVDLPRRTRLPVALLKQNNALVKQYKVGGFPTIIVIDAHGHALGGYTGGMTRLPDVQQALEPALSLHRHLQQAASSPDSQSRSAHLAAAYAAYPDHYRHFNAWLRSELESADPTNKTGWRTTLLAEQQMSALDADLTKCIMNRAAMMACFDRYLADAVEGNRPRILRLKDHYLTGLAANKLRTARNVEDVIAARDLQLQAADCEDNAELRAERIRRVHEVYAQPESLLRPAYRR